METVKKEAKVDFLSLPKSSLLWSPMMVKTYIRHERFVVLRVLELYVAVHLRGVERRMINGRAEPKDFERPNSSSNATRSKPKALARFSTLPAVHHRPFLDISFFFNSRWSKDENLKNAGDSLVFKARRRG